MLLNRDGSWLRGLLLLSLSSSVLAELVLHNTMGSVNEIRWSKVGSSGFIIDGDQLEFIQSPDGKAVGTRGTTHFSMDPRKFFGTDEPRKGTIALRIKKNASPLRGPNSARLGLVGFEPFHEGEGYDGVCAQWLSDTEEGAGGPSMSLMVMDSLHQAFFCRDEGFESIENGDWVTLAFIWDVDGIPSYGLAERMMIQRNGTITCMGWADNSMPMPAYKASSVLVAANYLLNSSTPPLVFIDEIKVWDEAMDCTAGTLDCVVYGTSWWPPTNSQIIAFSFFTLFFLLCSRASYELPEELLSKVKPQSEYELGDIHDDHTSDEAGGTSHKDLLASSSSDKHADVWGGIQQAFAGSEEELEASRLEESDTTVDQSAAASISIVQLEGALSEESDGSSADH